MRPPVHRNHKPPFRLNSVVEVCTWIYKGGPGSSCATRICHANLISVPKSLAFCGAQHLPAASKFLHSNVQAH